MSKLITPNWTINSVYHLTPDMLKKQGFEGVIVDLDNTLLAWNEYQLSQRMKHWIESMVRAGIKVFILSNNNRSRVERAMEGLDVSVDFMAQALKPRNKGFKRAMELFNLPKDSVVVIGDQVVTDVIGAHRMSLPVILVKPLVPHDNIYTWLNRTIEKGLLSIVKIDRRLDWGNTLD